MRNSYTIFVIPFLMLVNINMIAQEDKRLIFHLTVDASIEDVYKAWTTTEGIKTFFAPDGNIELKSFGAYHIYFFPDAPKGQRGSENNIVVSFEENKMISFTWDFPPSLISLRENQRTVILVRFEKIGENKTKVVFIQSGWGKSEDWVKGYEYFKSAWGKVVLARLKYRFEKGVIDWNNLPDYSGYTIEAIEEK